MLVFLVLVLRALCGKTRNATAEGAEGRRERKSILRPPHSSCPPVKSLCRLASSVSVTSVSFCSIRLRKSPSAKALSDRCTTSIPTSTWSRGPPTTTRRWPRWAASAVSEPAFWAGFDRGSVDGFRDYFRAAHRRSSRSGPAGTASSTSRGSASTPRKPRTSRSSREVIAMIPEFLDRPGVLGIGEIGLNKNTRNEVDRVPGAPRSGGEDRRADSDPHAAPGRQVPGHADDSRHALRRQPHRPRAACWSITSKSTRFAPCSTPAFGPG